MKKLLVLATMSLLFTACGSSHNNGHYYTHAELASLFVSELNLYGGYDVSLVKTYSDQTGYIVIYDYDFHEYNAIYVNSYLPGVDDPAYYLTHYGDAYYNLIPIGYNDYYDVYTGLIFEKVQSTPKDLEKYAALAEQKMVNKRADRVAAQFGLSVERSKEVVRLAVAWQKDGGKSLPDKVQDSYAKDLLGFTITDAKNAVTEKEAGNAKPLNELIKTAADQNDQTPEMLQQIISKYFSN
ncbi:MAG: hypothetical protein A2Z20_07670 [Bdellovibrionales bacterium RBG_16_40_8]|nr:MAG: hypothetical protein A2Z20_07670 [Bdellovibrionales bacterium RBG_16_40_8]